jgi:spore maturation protein CgeB
MRIFYASETSPNATFQSNIWRHNLYLPLVDLGHDVVEFQYDLRETFLYVDSQDPEQKKFIDRNRPRVTEELLRQIKAAHAVKPIELFFSYFYDACILPEALDEIRSMNIKTVNWYCNASYQLHLVSEISPHYDWCLVPEKFRLDDYVAMGAHPIYSQEGANPNIYKPYQLPQEFDVTFVGQAYGDRPAIVQYLLDQGIDIRVWGQGWRNFTTLAASGAQAVNPLRRTAQIGKRLLTAEGRKAAISRIFGALAPSRPDPTGSDNGHSNSESPRPTLLLPSHIVGGVLSDTELIQMYSRSKINVGFSTCGSTHEADERILQIRLRDFEVPMSGSFYMVEYMEDLEEFFNIGKEIVCYTDQEDLARKIKYYLEHTDERDRIRQAGYERCLRDHTWHKRFEVAFKKMGFE